MKTISTYLALAILVVGSLASCKNKTDKHNTAEANNAQHERPEHPPKDGHPPRDGHPPKDGHPPREHGDRKGPPRGGDHSPEQTKTLEEIGGYKIGEVAADFELKNVDGEMVSLANFKDAKGYVVVFTCNGCPFSKMYEDRLLSLNDTYAPKGYPVIAINPNVSEDSDKESYSEMQKRAKEKGFTFPYLADVNHEVSPKYGAVRTPHVFLLDSDKKVQYIGTIDDNAKSAEDAKVNYIEDAIEALENGKTPNPNFTKAIGCPVKTS